MNIQYKERGGRGGGGGEECTTFFIVCALIYRVGLDVRPKAQTRSIFSNSVVRVLQPAAYWYYFDFFTRSDATSISFMAARKNASEKMYQVCFFFFFLSHSVPLGACCVRCDIWCTGATLGVCVFPWVFLSSRVTGACPVTTDLIMRVKCENNNNRSAAGRFFSCFLYLAVFLAKILIL